MTKAEERQQFLELMRLAAQSNPGQFIDIEALQKEINEIYGITTERQRTLARLLGRKPEEFIP